MSQEQKKQNKPSINLVAVTSIDVPFTEVLYLMIKVGIAAIPAAFIVAIAYYAIITGLGELIGK